MRKEHSAKTALLPWKYIMTEVSQVLVSIPRNRLGKLNNAWNMNHARVGLKTKRKKSKRRPKTTAEVIQHLPILILKLNTNTDKGASFSSSETDACSDDTDEEGVSFTTKKTTHYKKEIIKKHCIANRNLIQSTFENDRNESKCDYRKQENSTCRNTAFDCTATTSAPDAEDPDMPSETKYDILILEKRLNASPNPSLPSQSITPTEQNKNNIGKHVLPTAMVPQQHNSRVALPLNDHSGITSQSPPSHLKTDEVTSQSYPNVAKESNVIQQHEDQQKPATQPQQQQQSSNVRRKKSTPIRRKSTITDEHRNLQEEIARNNHEQKVYTKQNGLELLSMVCTSTTPPNLPREDEDAKNVTTVNSTRMQKEVQPSNQIIHQNVPIYPSHLHKNTQVNQKIIGQTQSPQEIEHKDSQQHPEENKRNNPPPYNGMHYVPFPTMSPESAMQYHYFQQQMSAMMQIQQNGKTVEEPMRKRPKPPPKQIPNEQYIRQQQLQLQQFHHQQQLQLQQQQIYQNHPHYNQQHPMMVNMEYFQTRANNHPQKVVHGPQIHPHQHPDRNGAAYQQHMRQNQFVRPPFVQRPPPLQNNPGRQVIYRQGRADFPEPSRNPTESKILMPQSNQQQNLKEIDRNQTCTLYYESQNGKGLECTQQTIIYTEIPTIPDVTTASTVQTDKANNQRVIQAPVANKEVARYPEKDQTFRGVVVPCLVGELADMIADKITGKNARQIGEQLKNQERTASPPKDPIERSTPSVIMQNPTVSSNQLQKTFSHRIENFINPNQNSLDEDPPSANIVRTGEGRKEIEESSRPPSTVIVEARGIQISKEQTVQNTNAIRERNSSNDQENNSSFLVDVYDKNAEAEIIQIPVTDDQQDEDVIAIPADVDEPVRIAHSGDTAPNNGLSSEHKNGDTGSKDPKLNPNNNTLFDTQYNPNDTVENIFPQILPNCFMILNLIQEMQNDMNVNWWPVDTSGNLMKIQLSFMGITGFWKRCKMLAVHLDPYIHHFFLFLLECFETFKERVWKVLEKGYTMKENYIPRSEASIYRDVFVQLYEYFYSNAVTRYANYATKTETSILTKRENEEEDEGMEVKTSTDLEFHQDHQKHMLIVEKIRQKMMSEEKRNENFRNFISHLNQENQATPLRNSEGDSDFVKFPIPFMIKTNPEEDKSIVKANPKRMVELIVIDSDSDEDNKLSAGRMGNLETPSKRRRLRNNTNPTYKISGVIQIDDDEQSERISQVKRKSIESSTEINKRICNETNDNKQDNLSYQNEKQDKIQSLINNKMHPGIEVCDDFSKDDKNKLLETIRLMSNQNGDKTGIIRVENEVIEINDSNEFKQEIKNENAILTRKIEEDTNEEQNLVVTEANSINSEGCETIEAIKNFIKETDFQEHNTTSLKASPTVDIAKINQNIPVTVFSSTQTHGNENKLIGIATPNVKDADANNRKTNQLIPNKITDKNHIGDVRTVEEVPIGLGIENMREEELLAHDFLENMDKDKNKEREVIQKLISFRKPIKKVIQNNPIAVTPAVNLEKNKQNSNPKPEEENNYTSLGIQEAPATQRGTHEVNNNLNSPAPNKVINSQFAIGKQNHGNHQENVEQRTSIGILTKESSSIVQGSDVHTTKQVAKSNSSNDSDNLSSVSRQAKIAITEYFIAKELYSGQLTKPKSPDASTSKSRNSRVTFKLPVTETHLQPGHPHPQQHKDKIQHIASSKELLRQAVTRKQSIQSSPHQRASTQPSDPSKSRSKPRPTSIPSLQSIYNDNISTNGFISQYLKEEIGVLSKKESLDPVEYVEEVTTLLKLTLIPRDFKDFYIFVTKQQILQLHQPIAFYIFLELLNQSGLKDYHKKFTAYTRRKFQEKLSSGRGQQSQNQRNT